MCAEDLGVASSRLSLPPSRFIDLFAGSSQHCHSRFTPALPFRLYMEMSDFRACNWEGEKIGWGGWWGRGGWPPRGGGS